MIHLYALGSAPLHAELRGIDAASVTTIETGGIHAVISRHDDPVVPSPEAALTHVATIEAVAEHLDVAPVRFGRGHADAAALRTKLEASLPEFGDLLRRVAGHVEFLVRSADAAVHDQDRPGFGDRSAEWGTGRAYLEGRRAALLAAAERRRRAEGRLAASTAPLDEHAVATRDLVGPRGPERCFLVARARASAFQSRLQAFVGSDGSMVVGGPWPPFSFATSPSAPEVTR